MGESIVAGIISGIISSVFLYIVLFRIKPKILVSESICRSAKDSLFRIKIVNMTHSNLIDVKYTLHACYRSVDGIVSIEEIKPEKLPVEFIQAYSKDDKNADFAIRISFDPERKVDLSKYDYFLFTFFAKHSFSGTTLFIRREYSKADVKCGQFETGTSSKVIIESTCHNTYNSCDRACACIGKKSPDG